MFINKSNNPLPEHQTTLSLGFDLYSNEEVTLKPGERYAVGTGLYFDPEHALVKEQRSRPVKMSNQIYELLGLEIRPRSGLALNHGITVLNSPGTIDLDYPDEIKVILVNLSDKEYKIKVGDKIAQGLFTTFQQIMPVINRTRTGGFGSTN